MPNKTVMVQCRVDVTPEVVAGMFADMDDDSQVQFFVHVAALFATFKSLGGDWQIHAIGKHLAECECSSEGARDWVIALADAVKEHTK